MSEIYPIHYSIHLEPDLERFRFDGTVQITLAAEAAVDEVVLNAIDLNGISCRIRQEDRSAPCALSVDADREEMKIRLPEAVRGRFVLDIVYQGRIGDNMAGFYRSSYLKDGSRRFVAVTQFEESDARRAFPCMDHPSRKATFEIEITANAGQTVLSNAAVQSVQPLDGGRQRVKFDTTPKMSTYLVFWGVGDFRQVEKEGEKRVRVLTLPGMESYAGFGLEFGRQALDFCESYFDVPYPLSKLDLIAIPDFAFGAMENWGAITFRENLLLRYPGITSKSGEGRICEIISHEIVHQWFGNLVTPSDWKYLWLNESFATYFGYGIVDHYHPDWGVWEQFLYGQTSVAMSRDALMENFPIEIPGGAHVVINSSTAPIIYSKGGSILRQIHGYIGDAYFKAGLRRYLKSNAYACAESDDLWQSFEAASELPVTRIMKSWIGQPGFPVLTVLRSGKTLTIAQQRFTYLPCNSDQTWMVPVTITAFSETGESTRLNLILDGSGTSIDLPENTAAYKVNTGQTGFYRVKYEDAANLNALGAAVRKKVLSPEDRWGLHGDLSALLIRGDVSLEFYLAFLNNYGEEDAYLPMVGIADSLSHFWLIREDARPKIAGAAVPLLEAVLDRIGYEAGADEAYTRTVLRDQILWQAASLGSSAAADFGSSHFKRLKAGAAVNPDILKSVMQIGALAEGQGAFEWLDRRFRESASEQERINILMAMGCFSDPAVISKTLDYVMDRVPARNQFVPVVSMASNSAAVPLLWDWYTTNLARIETFHPLLHERIITAIVPSAGMCRTDEIRNYFTSYLTRSDKGRDAIKLALERLEINLQVRKQ